MFNLDFDLIKDRHRSNDLRVLATPAGSKVAQVAKNAVKPTASEEGAAKLGIPQSSALMWLQSN